jgi:hypothetical protein
MRTGHWYRGVQIQRASWNNSGPRWFAILADGTWLRAETLGGIRELIREELA